MTQAGPAIPVIAVTDRYADGGPTLRVAVVSDGRPTEGGPARPVIVVMDGRPTQGNVPVPIVVATGVQAGQVLAGPAIPVVVVSGSLNPGPAAYALLRDAFTDTASPMVDGAAQPGAGTRDVTGTRWRTELGKLFGGSAVGEGSWGNSKDVYTRDGGLFYDRVNGRTLWAVLKIEDRQSPLAFSWASATNIADPRADGHGWFILDGSLDITTPGAAVAIDASIYDMRPMLYLIAVVLFDQGAAVLISTVSIDGTTSPGRTTPWSVPAYPSAAVAYVTWRGTTTPLYPSLSAKESPSAGEAINGHTVDDVRVIDVVSWAALDSLATFADRFTRADNATTPGNSWVNDRGTWGILSNRLYISNQPGAQMANCRREIGMSDGTYHWTINVGGVIGQFAVTFRHASAGNFIRFSNNGTNNTWQLQIYVAGAFSSGIVSGPTTWAINTTYEIVIKMIGNKYFIAKDDVVLTTNWATDATNTYLAGTGIGVGTFDSVANAPTFDNVAAYPLTTTLPAELQATQSLAVFQETAGATLGSDTFTDANGTLLTAHTPTAGPSWTVPLAGANATIQSNRLSLGGAGAQLALQAIGTAYHECQVDVILPGSLGNFTFAGICVAYVDSTNWFVARLAADYVAQPLVHEIEVMRSIAGVVTVVGKVPLAVYFVAGNTVALKTQVVSDGKGSNVVQIFLGGNYVESYYLPPALNTSASAGLYRDATTDSGAVFDNWRAKAL